MSDGADQPKAGLGGALGGMLAAVGIILSNLATVLKSLKDLRDAVGLDWLTLPVVSRSWWTILILLVGNGILLWWIYRYIPKEHPTKRLIGAGAAVVVVVLIFAFNLFALPRQLPDIPEAVHKQLVTQLLGVQVRDGVNFQGFNDGLSSATQEDTWSTAQSLVAILTAVGEVESIRPRLTGAFNFIESRKDSAAGPCALWVQQVGTSKLTRTDIAGWVAMAYLRSIASDQVWQSAEIEPAVNRTVNILDCLAARQDQTGAWGPTASHSVTSDRTYPTVIAIWALSEAKRTKLVREQVKSRYDAAINGGVQWLLRNYHNPAGWYPDPSVLKDGCDGLNSQALFVLSRVEHLPGIDDLSRDGTYKSIKHNFLNSPAPQQPAGHPCRPADQRFEVDGEVLFVSFLDYPWALASAKALAQDGSLSLSDRKKASEIYATLVSESESLANGFPIDAYTFQLSETLTCMFYK